MPSREPEMLNPVAGLLAVLLPGAGHLYLRKTRRGVMILIGVLGLFFGGMFVGGIDVIDSREDKLWFYGQALVGPIAIAVDRFHQAQKIPDPNARGQTMTPPPGSPNAFNEKSLGKMNELGTLFATIAGMLNLIAILDALFPRPELTEEEVAALHATGIKT